MNPVQELNFRGLIVEYHDGNRKVSEGAKFLRSKKTSDKTLSRVLRNHVDEPITSAKEIDRRWAVDELLSFYSRLELACLAGFVTPPFSGGFRERALQELTRPAVECYYSEFYPQLLPNLFVRRLKGDWDVVEPAAREVPAVYMQFTNLTDELDQDEDVSIFVDFLDDFVVDGYSWVDLRRALSDPKRFVKHLAVEPEEQTALQSAVHGYRRFLLFCRDFDVFLQQIGNLPLVQSGAWHYHAYWFKHLHERIGDVVRRSSDAIIKEAEASFSLEDSEQVKAGVGEFDAAVQRLTSIEYQTALEQAAEAPHG